MLHKADVETCCGGGLLLEEWLSLFLMVAAEFFVNRNWRQGCRRR